jgi:hypothetical protein
VSSVRTITNGAINGRAGGIQTRKGCLNGPQKSSIAMYIYIYIYIHQQKPPQEVVH